MSIHTPFGDVPGETDQPFTVRCPEDVIALVPVVLGFHPTESVVLLTFGAPTGSFHARVDLPVTAEGIAEVTSILARAVAVNGPDTAMVVICSDDHDAAAAAFEPLAPAIGRAGADVVEGLRIDGGRWWSLWETDPAPHPYDVSAHPFTARHVLAGEVVQPDRQSVADSLVGTDEDAAQRLGVAVERLQDRPVDRVAEADWLRRWAVERSAARREGFVPIGETDAARVLMLVQDDEMREVACLDLTRRRARAACETWVELVRRAPPGLVVGPAAMLALSAWLAGDGALSWCAIDRALEEDAGCGLARAVARALQGAVPPSSWDPPDAAACRLLAADERVS